MSVAISVRRHAALLFFAVLLLSLLLSAAFVLAEQHHDCTGEHCQICQAVAHSVAYLKAEGSHAVLPAQAVLTTHVSLAQQVPQPGSAALERSPVSLKVKLSD